MRKIHARSLLSFTIEDLWETLTGDFVLVFDDGELPTNAKETLYSCYGWDFHHLYPATPLLIKHHLRGVLGNKRLGSDTHLELLGNVMWSVYDEYIKSDYLSQINLTEPQFRDILAEKIYRTTNLMYNDLSYRLEEYVASLDIVDFIEVLDHPRVKAVNDRLTSIPPEQLAVLSNSEGQRLINDATNVITGVLTSDRELSENPLSLASRSKLVNISQVLQCVGPRGYLTDTDSNLFHQPIMRGYAMGMRSFYDSFVESRSAAKSLIFSKSPLQQAEYFSRRLQLMSQIVQRLHYGDCGSTKYVHWNVRATKLGSNGAKQAGDLKQMVGKYYMDDDGLLKVIHPNDVHLNGRTLKLRTAIHCAHPDPYGICSTCFGDLSYSVPEGTNIGQLCCTSLAQKSSQNVLSVKHLDGSSEVDGIVLDQLAQQYLKVGADDNSYLLADRLKGRNVKLVIPEENATNMTDIMDAPDIYEINITRISELTTIGIMLDDAAYEPIMEIDVSLNRRLASMRYPLLEHIRKNGWTVNSRNDNVIDMAGYDWSEPILSLPLKHFNMSDHSRDIASMLESSVDKLQERDGQVSPDVALVDLFDLVNERLTVNLAVLDVVLYATMIISVEDKNFGLPKPWSRARLGVMKTSMANRSLGPEMAYEGHRDIIINPISYNRSNRTDHPMDGILCPAEKFEGKASI